jgi:type IV pilus assembly protein PilO
MALQLTKEQQQLVVAVALFAGGGGYAYFRYFLLPTAKSISETGKAIESIEEKIRTVQSQAVGLKKIEQEYNALQEKAKSAERRLPREEDLPAVIVTASALCRQSGLDLVSFTTGRPSPRDYFIEIPYAINLRGRYHDIGRFFATIALEERIFNVRGVVYGTPDTAGKMAVSFNLIAYQYKGS